MLRRAPPASRARRPRGPCRRRRGRRRRSRCPRLRACARPGRSGRFDKHQRDLGRISGDPSPLRSAPPCWSRGRRSGRRRAFLAMASPGEIEVPAIGDARARRPRPRTTSPRRTTVSPARDQRAATASASSGRDHRDHADAAIERAQHFAARRSRPPSASQRKTGSTGTRARSSAAPSPSAARAGCCREIRRR